MDPVRTIVAAVMLLGATWWDLRERRVPNTYWFPFVAMAAVFVAVDMADGAWPDLLGAALVALLAYVFFRFGLWGGADAKGIMVLAFLVREHLGGVTTVAVLDTLVAGLALVLLLPIGLTVWNLAHGHLVVPAMFIGRPMPIHAAKQRLVWPLQDADGWRYRARIGEDTAPVYHALHQQGRTHVWVTQKLPTMAFITAGFLLVSFTGSPMGWLAGTL